jgi:hypothetical protein
VCLARSARRRTRRLGHKTLGMESSTVLAFRIFVMLSCLIIVPMAAIFGSAFPDVVKSVLVDRIVAWSTGKPLETAQPAPEEAGFSALTPMPPATGERRDNQWEAPRWGGGSAGVAAAWSPPPGSQTGGVVPAGAPSAHQGGGNQSASFAAPADPNRAAPASYPVERSSVDEAARANAPEYPSTSQPNPFRIAGQPGTESLAGQSNPAQPEQPDRFRMMERKLREYGAVYYLLETWGTEGELYRFHCRMAITNNPNYTRHFEATDRDALKAMSQVLARVEAWRAGRLQ